MRLLGWNCCTVGALVWIAVSGCNVYDPELIETSVAGAPPRPPAETSSPADVETLVFALKDIYITQSAENAVRIGIDLDSVTTTGQDDASCQPRKVDGEVVGQAVVDGEKGIDNSLGTTLLPTVGADTPVPSGQPRPYAGSRNRHRRPLGSWVEWPTQRRKCLGHADHRGRRHQ